MIMNSDRERCFVCIGRLLCLCAIVFLSISVWAQSPSTEPTPHDHQHMAMGADDAGQANEHDRAEALTSKKESEFNHHLAGIFVILAGLLCSRGIAQAATAVAPSSLRVASLFLARRIVPAGIQ